MKPPHAVLVASHGGVSWQRCDGRWGFEPKITLDKMEARLRKQGVKTFEKLTASLEDIE